MRPLLYVGGGALLGAAAAAAVAWVWLISQEWW